MSEETKKSAPVSESEANSASIENETTPAGPAVQTQAKEDIMRSLVESASQIPSDNAFPMSLKMEYTEERPAVIAYRKGLTKREYYAGLAMSSMAARLTKLNAPDVDFVAHEAVRMADALLEALTDKEA